MISMTATHLEVHAQAVAAVTPTAPDELPRLLKPHSDVLSKSQGILPRTARTTINRRRQLDHPVEDNPIPLQRPMQELQEYQSWYKVLHVDQVLREKLPVRLLPLLRNVKSHFIRDHGSIKRPPQQPLKSAMKDGSKHPKVKFSKASRATGAIHRVQRSATSSAPTDDIESLGTRRSAVTAACP
jgi:hypothetical protein